MVGKASVSLIQGFLTYIYLPTPAASSESDENGDGGVREEVTKLVEVATTVRE